VQAQKAKINKMWVIFKLGLAERKKSENESRFTAIESEGDLDLGAVVKMK